MLGAIIGEIFPTGFSMICPNIQDFFFYMVNSTTQRRVLSSHRHYTIKIGTKNVQNKYLLI